MKKVRIAELNKGDVFVKGPYGIQYVVTGRVEGHIIFYRVGGGRREKMAGNSNLFVIKINNNDVLR